LRAIRHLLRLSTIRHHYLIDKKVPQKALQRIPQRQGRRKTTEIKKKNQRIADEIQILCLVDELGTEKTG
jgi:hypothetical protein